MSRFRIIPPVLHNRDPANGWRYVYPLSPIPILTLITAMLMLRTYALYEQSKRILALMIAFTLGAVGVGIVRCFLSLQRPPQISTVVGPLRKSCRQEHQFAPLFRMQLPDFQGAVSFHSHSTSPAEPEMLQRSQSRHRLGWSCRFRLHDFPPHAV